VINFIELTDFPNPVGVSGSDIDRECLFLRSTLAVALFCGALFYGFAAVGQAATLCSDPDSLSACEIPRFESVDIRIDGELDEPIWNTLPAYDGMRVILPDVLSPARYRTQTRFAYTSKGLYVGIWAEQPPESLVERLSARDEEINRDATYLYLDTSGKGIYGVFFGVNLGGTLTDGTVLPERQLSRLWDGPWDGRTRATEDGYTTEMFLPWSMMSMPKAHGERQMAFSVERRVASLDETWSFPALPTTQPQFLSGFQPIQFEEVNAGQQLAVFPYVSTTTDQIYDETTFRAGADLFWRPSSNLQLTATLNPDFGTVELDDVIINLTAFETFFPEKRLFFLEGNEIFITSPRAAPRPSSGGPGARGLPDTFFLQPTTLLNTRRIGGAPIPPEIPPGVEVPDTELSQPSELIGAFKTTGKAGRVQYGLMLASEDDTRFRAMTEDGMPADLEQDGRDFGIARFLYEHSSVGRKAIGWMSTIAAHPDRDAASHGLDLHYRSPRSQVIWDAQLLHSNIDSENGYGGFIDLNYLPRQGVLHRFSFDYLDDKLDINDLGFLRRNESLAVRYSLTRTRSKLKNFRNWVSLLSLGHEQNATSGRAVRSTVFFRNILTLQNSSAISAVLMYKPEQWDDRLSEGHGDFKTAQGGIAEISYGTNTSRVFSAALGFNAMTEALGDWTYSVKAGITFKPSDRFSFDFDFQYRKTDEWLIHLEGPLLGTYDANHFQPAVSMDLFFSARQQLRFSLQWVGIQAAGQQLYSPPPEGGDLIEVGGPEEAANADFTVSRLATQLRYRWTIAPLSDLFIVYTRGSNLPNRGYDTMSNLFQDALNDPIVDQFIIKLRYRFGN